MGELSSLFKLIRDYLTRYLPNEKKYGKNTIRSYRKSLELLLDYVKMQNNIPLIKVSFDMIDRYVLAEFLDYLESDRGCSPSTRNQRLSCIRAFYAYAAENDITAVA